MDKAHVNLLMLVHWNHHEVVDRVVGFSCNWGRDKTERCVEVGLVHFSVMRVEARHGLHYMILSRWGSGVESVGIFGVTRRLSWQ